jgi:hypothetical protein
MWIRLKVEIAVWSWLAQKEIDVMGNIINETKTKLKKQPAPRRFHT